MSGRRCRALRAAFVKAHGRRPEKGTQLYGWRRGGITSEWRRLKRGRAVAQ